MTHNLAVNTEQTIVIPILFLLDRRYRVDNLHKRLLVRFSSFLRFWFFHELQGL